MHLTTFIRFTATLGALLGCMTALAGTPTVTAAPPDTASEARLDARINALMDESGLVGMGAAIVIDKQQVWARGYGFADRQQARPFTPDTVMNIGSISKTVTGVALMQAVEDGRLSLDADINTYLPFKVVNPSFPDTPITLRQLATHTSSITDRWEVYQRVYHWGGDAPDTLGDFLADYLVPGGKDHARESFLPVRPGRHREYSNIGAALAGFIVERAVGQPLDAYTKQRIFEPLGMTRSGWSLADAPVDAQATLYVVQDAFAIPIQPYGLITYPDGGVRTSVSDLTRLFIALLDDGRYQGTQILAPTTTREMLRYQYDAGHTPDNVDLAEKNSGIFWSTKFNTTRIGHGGSDPGIRTEMLSDLDQEIGVVVFTNTSLSGPEAKVYGEVLQALWEHAEALNGQALKD